MRFERCASEAPVRVAVIDSGIDASVLGRRPAEVSAARFALDAVGGPDAPPLCRLPPVGDPLGHGTEVARLILAAAPDAQLLDAQVFADDRPVAGLAAVATVAVVATAIDWAIAQGAQLINFSLGLREDCWVLRHACARARAGGVLLVASAPARGGPVYPATYPGVLAATGDARCAEGQWSFLERSPGVMVGPAALVGACPGPRSAGEVGGGASYAAARLCGLLARWVQMQSPVGPGADIATPVIEHLATGAAYRGRERYYSEYAACPSPTLPSRSSIRTASPR